MDLILPNKNFPHNVDRKQFKNAINFYAEYLFSRYLNKVRIVIKFCDTDEMGTKNLADCSYLDSNYRPREFLIRFLKKSKGHILYTRLAHEMVHIKQFLTGELFDYIKDDNCRFKGKIYEFYDDDISELYHMAPWEIEARGLEDGLFVLFKQEFNLSNRKLLKPKKDLRNFKIEARKDNLSFGKDGNGCISGISKKSKDSIMHSA